MPHQSPLLATKLECQYQKINNTEKVVFEKTIQNCLNMFL